MQFYYSTFISGFQELVEEELGKILTDVKITLLIDGLVVYQTSAGVDQIRQIRFFNNSYLLLYLFKPTHINPNYREKSQLFRIERFRTSRNDKNEDSRFSRGDNNQINAIYTMLKYVKDNPHLYQSLPFSIKRANKTFRIIVSIENNLVSVDKNIVRKLEENIVRQTRLKVDRSLPDIEFWLLQRREGYGFFGIRLTKHRDYAKTLQKGELRPELANFLCLLSEPKLTDIFLDPFCGSGTISLARMKLGKVKKIIASDNDTLIINKLKQKFRADFRPKLLKNLRSTQIERFRTSSPRYSSGEAGRNDKKAGQDDILGKREVKKADALHLLEIANNSIDKIVTDPPWGFYNQTDPSAKNPSPYPLPKGEGKKKTFPVKINSLTHEVLYNFYYQMLGEFYRILKPNGLLVILIGQKELFENTLKQFGEKLQILRKYDILVSGKKAGVYKIKIVKN